MLEQVNLRRAAVMKLRRRPRLVTAPPRDWLTRAGNTPGVRVDKIRAIREALDDGRYDLEDKLAAFAQRYLQPTEDDDGPDWAA